MDGDGTEVIGRVINVDCVGVIERKCHLTFYESFEEAFKALKAYETSSMEVSCDIHGNKPTQPSIISIDHCQCLLPRLLPAPSGPARIFNTFLINLFSSISNLMKTKTFYTTQKHRKCSPEKTVRKSPKQTTYTTAIRNYPLFTFSIPSPEK